jgi:hypothetical protein
MSIIDNSQLVEQLVRSDAISKADLRRGLDLAKERGEGLYETLIAEELIDERALVKAVGKMLNVRPVWLGDRLPDTDVTDRVPRSLAVRNKVLPLKFEAGEENERLVLAMADPLDVLAMDEIASHTGVDVRPVLAGLGDLLRGLERVYGADGLDTSAETSLDALEQAASGEADSSGVSGLEVSSSDTSKSDTSKSDTSKSEAVEPEDDDDLSVLSESDLIDEVDDDGLSDDSWAAFFDDAEEIDYTEDSSVISRDMQDRAISSILDAVDPESESESDEEDSLKSLDEPLSKSQITGGIEPDLGAWEVDGALDGKESKDYAKIGHLFVYSPEKISEHSEAEEVEKEATGEKERKREREKEKEKEKEKKASHEGEASEKPLSAGLENDGPGNAPSKAAAIINPKKKLVPKAKSEASESLDEDSEADDESADHTSVGGGFFGADDPSDSVDESRDQEDDEDDEDDEDSNTAFGFGLASLLADDSEPTPEKPTPEKPTPEKPTPEKPAPEEPSKVQAPEAPASEDSAAADSLQATFVARLAEVAVLDEDSQRLIEAASSEDLIYAVVLALVQDDVLDVRDLVEYIGSR